MAWDAALKLTKVQLQLLTKDDMYLFVEKGIRGRITTITKRLATTNNPEYLVMILFKSWFHLLYVNADNLVSAQLPNHLITPDSLTVPNAESIIFPD